MTTLPYNDALTNLLSLADILADKAGDVLRLYFRAPLPVDRKADHSPVTQADREAEGAMRDVLESLSDEYGIFGEESGRLRPEARMQWVLDPLDGTRPFLAGYPTFTTLIALTDNGVPVLGTIDQPVLRERWKAVQRGHTECNGRPVRTSGVTQLKDATLATTSLDYFSPGQVDSFARVRGQVRTALYGGDAYAYAMLASGHVDCVVDMGMKPYDFCALVPVVEGAGGVITDWSGAPLRIDSLGDVAAAATPELHAAVLKALHR